MGFPSPSSPQGGTPPLLVNSKSPSGDWYFWPNSQFCHIVPCKRRTRIHTVEQGGTAEGSVWKSLQSVNQYLPDSRETSTCKNQQESRRSVHLAGMGRIRKKTSGGVLSCGGVTCLANLNFYHICSPLLPSHWNQRPIWQDTETIHIPHSTLPCATPAKLAVAIVTRGNRLLLYGIVPVLCFCSIRTSKWKARGTELSLISKSI